MGIITLIKPAIIDTDARKIHLPMLFIGAVLLFFMGLGIFGESCVINEYEGVILIAIFAVYFLLPIIKKLPQIKEIYIKEKRREKEKDYKIIMSFLKIILGAILLKYGGDFVVKNAESLAQMYNLSERVIGLTIVAIGTALPEFVTSLTATLKGDTDLAVGNLIGSCTFNTFFIIGIASIISPIKYVPEFKANIALLGCAAFIVWIFNYIGTRNKLNREQGFILVYIYIIYSLSLFW